MDSNDYVQSYYRNLLEFGNAEVNANLYNYQAKQNKDSTLSKSLDITNALQKKTVGVNLHPSLNIGKGGRMNDHSGADFFASSNEKNSEKMKAPSSSSSRRASTKSAPSASFVRRSSK